MLHIANYAHQTLAVSHIGTLWVKLICICTKEYICSIQAFEPLVVYLERNCVYTFVQIGESRPHICTASGVPKIFNYE